MLFNVKVVTPAEYDAHIAELKLRVSRASWKPPGSTPRAT